MTDPPIDSPIDSPPRRLLEGLRVLETGGEPVAIAGRILADLGAHVTKVELPAGSPLRLTMPFAPAVGSLRHAAWDAGKQSVVVSGADDPLLDELLADADVVLATPGWHGTLELGRASAPHACWIDVTPFGLTGPRAHWRAGDLGILAASGNLYVTGDADRPPVRAAQPVSFAHAGPEIAFAALTAIASGRPQHVDLSMQEVVTVANMGAVGRFAREHQRGRRRGANIGRTREIWPCADGFVSFGLRGGKARVASLRTLARLVEDAGLATPAFRAITWETFDQNTATDDELATIVEPVAAYFASRTMDELYAIAVDTNLMLAPACSPREIYASAQLASRDFFTTLGPIEGVPRTFVHVRDPRGAVAQPGPSRPAPALGDHDHDHDHDRFRVEFGAPGPRIRRESARNEGAWHGTCIVELGSGAAGPIATRYFAEHGATVIRVESTSRPDFLRTYATGKDARRLGLDGSPMFDALNPGKRSVTLDLKHPEGNALARRLIVEWADAVSENFAPKAMPGLGLDYDRLVADKPDLVMVSACLNGQTGPHRDYPGFGGQGAALSGYNFLTGWPDREPIGPFGTITDSLAPRFVATALGAGLLYRARTGAGVYLDLSQVECALYSLSPWLLDFAVNGQIVTRAGNADPFLPDLVPHGVYPSAPDGDVDDRWIAVTPTDATDWPALESLMGLDAAILAGPFDARVAALDDAVTAFTSSRTALEAAEQLQAIGLAAVPVQDFADAHDDPQLAHRRHLVELDHAALGPGHYERNGFRLSDGDATYPAPSPLLGQDNAWVLGELLGLDGREQARLAEAGVLR